MQPSLKVFRTLQARSAPLVVQLPRNKNVANKDDIWVEMIACRLRTLDNSVTLKWAISRLKMQRMA